MRKWVLRGVRVLLAFCFGFGWAAAVFVIPFVTAILTENTNTQSIFRVELFLVITAVGCYSQTIVDNLAKTVARLVDGIGGSDDGWRSTARVALSNVALVVLATLGVFIIFFWFAVQKGGRYDFNGTVYNLDFFKNSWYFAVVMMPVLGVIQSWRHPFFKPATGEPI